MNPVFQAKSGGEPVTMKPCIDVQPWLGNESKG